MENNLRTNSSANIIDVAAAIENLESGLEKSINAISLYKSDRMQIMLITLNNQAELKKHTAPGPISVQVIKGSISFRVDEKSYDLALGQLLILEGNIPHSVYANEHSTFLVTKSIRE